MLIRNAHKPLVRIAIVGAALSLFLIGYQWGNQYRQRDAQPPVIMGILMVPALPLRDFALEDGQGLPFTQDSLGGRWTLFAFGDPGQQAGAAAIRRMIEVWNRLAGDPALQKLLQLALAAPDPTTVRAHDFGPLSEVLRILSGDADTVASLRSSLGAPIGTEAESAAEGVPFYLVGPKGRVLALFPGAQTPAAIASDLSVIATSFETLYPDAD